MFKKIFIFILIFTIWIFLSPFQSKFFFTILDFQKICVTYQYLYYITK